MYKKSNLTVILTDQNGNVRDTYYDGVDDGRVVITTDRSIYDHTIRVNEEYGSWGYEMF